MNLVHRIAQTLMGVWVGGVACVAFLVAPRVFEVLRSQPISNHLSKERQGQVAGELLAPIFANVDKFGILVAIVFLVAAWGTRGRAVLAAVLGICAAVNLFVAGPMIEARGDGFETWHLIATGLWLAILVGGSILAVVGPNRPAARG
jgi:hypothetical protein